MDYYVADVVSQSDYYPYGMLMPNTSVAPDEKDFRYTFNGKEFIPEVSGNGNIYDYGFRIYNPRLGKFLSEDPLTASYPWYTPYQFAGNTPIMAIDLDGLEEFIMIEQSDGTYKAIWDIKARERGEAGTIQYIDAAGNIVQQVNKNGDLVNFRRVNDYESQNSFIDQRRRVENIEGQNSSKKYLHYPIGSTRSDNLPHTALKLEDGTPSGEPFLDANTLIAPPPPSIEDNSPNGGGKVWKDITTSNENTLGMQGDGRGFQDISDANLLAYRNSSFSGLNDIAQQIIETGVTDVTISVDLVVNMSSGGGIEAGRIRDAHESEETAESVAHALRVLGVSDNVNITVKIDAGINRIDGGINYKSVKVTNQ